MSSLIFYTDQERALVVTDTLQVKFGQPTNFTTKALYLPHLRLIVAGTGHGGFHDRWAHLVNFSAVARDVVDLNIGTPGGLRKLWARVDDDLKVRTTTIYHFGVTTADQVVAYAYRSANDFRSEPLEPGTGIKPKASMPEGDLLEGIRAIMDEQRRLQEAAPAATRLYIGGEAIATYLTPAECRHWTLFRFSDADQQLDQAARRLTARS